MSRDSRRKVDDGCDECDEKGEEEGRCLNIRNLTFPLLD
jgi:hypothetical protein